ncbi:hypothetical protein AB3X82_25195 [Paraburkholderia phenoliruptrix]|uniref:Uncharacterized protein n=1 Tax=Paraburkholderia phenoliruptrix TaxID=252970 RepID=A0ABV3WL01_9BURK|nr:hypothetical protein [Paraburkholderia phenoliruptrix]MDR6393230.1 hypothetical protein [Paraburkholderia phenoliruptrix]
MKAHDVLLEHLKQTVTIASATLALTIGFIKDILGPATGNLRAEWLLKASWGLLGLVILLAIYVLATLINNLDTAGRSAEKAFKAGDNRLRQLVTLGTFLSFGVGMLFLGLFAALNYDSVVHRPPQNVAVGSATLAIEAAKKATPNAQDIKRVASVDLIPGAGGSGSPSAVWHVVLETRGTQSAVPPSGIASSARPAGGAAKPKGKRRHTVVSHTPPAQAADTSPALQRVDYYIDAKTGAVTVQP